MTEELLAKAIQNEIKARDFYGQVSKNVTVSKVKKMIAKIAKDEVGHISVLSRRFRKLFNRDYTPVANEPDPRLKVAEALAYTVDTARDILSLAIGFEDEAIEFYSEQWERTEDQEEKGMLEKLARFERSHKKKFQSLYARLDKGFTWTGKK